MGCEGGAAGGAEVDGGGADAGPVLVNEGRDGRGETGGAKAAVAGGEMGW